MTNGQLDDAKIANNYDYDNNEATRLMKTEHCSMRYIVKNDGDFKLDVDRGNTGEFTKLIRFKDSVCNFYGKTEQHTVNVRFNYKNGHV